MDLKEVKAVAIASVVPPLDQTLKQHGCEFLKLTPLFVDHTTDTGLKIALRSAVGSRR